MKTVLRLAAYFAVIFVLTTVVYAEGECVSAEGDPIRVGAIFPQGALFTAQSADNFQGVEAMRQAINACGGVNGRSVEWVYEPARSRDEAITAARHLAEQGVTLIVGSGSLAVSEGIREVTAELGILYWEMTEAIEAGGDGFFSVRPSNYQLGIGAAQFVNSALPDAFASEALRVALVVEDRPRGQAVAEGILDTLTTPPVIELHYDDDLWDTYPLAVEIREEKIDVVMLAAFENDGSYLWYDLREADANIQSWIHIGSEGYPLEMCQQFGNIEGFVSVDAAGIVSADYREQIGGEIYSLYRSTYLELYSTEPSETADLSASGVYLLLHHILPEVEGDYTADNLLKAAQSVTITEATGLMGEGFGFDTTNWLNQYPGVVIEQQQGGMFCTIWPAAIATCGGIQSFPTWRERALADERGHTCRPQT